MGWILIIIQIISAIPSIIRIIKEILGLINKLPKAERKAARGKLKTILKDVDKTKTVSDVQASELALFKEELKRKVRSKDML